MHTRATIFGIVALAAITKTASGQERDHLGNVRYRHRDCIQGVVFVPVPLESLASLLPRGLRPMEATPFHPSFAGHGAVAVVHQSCLGDGESQAPYAFSIIATPLDSVAIEGSTFGQVRFDWFELERFVDASPRAVALLHSGVLARVARLSSTAPSSDSAPKALFRATEGSDSLYRFEVVSRTAVDFPPQAHRFWRFSDQQFGYSQMTFPLHHSWIGQAPDCSFFNRLGLMKLLGRSPCAEKFAVSELIPNVTFEETVVPLGAALLKPKHLSPKH